MSSIQINIALKSVISDSIHNPLVCWDGAFVSANLWELDQKVNNYLLN